MRTVWEPLTCPTGPEPNPAKRMLEPVPTSARADRSVSRETFAVPTTVTVAGLLVAEPAGFVATHV